MCIVSPAAETANNGNGQTAARWSRFLSSVADVHVALAWRGEPVGAMIALHARRSADSVLRFRTAGNARLALVLTGTDLYRDIDSDEDAQHAVKCASHVVVLQEEGLNRLGPGIRAKTRVIVQSAAKTPRQEKTTRHLALVAVGHLRQEKDPLVLMRAAGLLPPGSPITILHLGDPLDGALADAARQATAGCACYRWLGGVPHDVARRWIARSHALVHMSRMEGGANVVIEAIRSGVPVLASRIDGNVGLLGRDYEGYFPVGDAAGLAALMQRFQAEPGFAAALAAQCALRAPRFAPQVERRSVRNLLADLLNMPAGDEPKGEPPG